MKARRTEIEPAGGESIVQFTKNLVDVAQTSGGVVFGTFNGTYVEYDSSWTVDRLLTLIWTLQRELNRKGAKDETD